MAMNPCGIDESAVSGARGAERDQAEELPHQHAQGHSDRDPVGHVDGEPLDQPGSGEVPLSAIRIAR